MKIFGFTGTRKGMTDKQKKVVSDYFKGNHPFEFHHGDCVGADKEAGDLANINNVSQIILHPPNNPRFRAFCSAEVIMPERTYTARDHDIVDSCQTMLATPRGFVEELRSGTWATIRYSKKTNRHIVIIFPDGSTEELNKNDLTF